MSLLPMSWSLPPWLRSRSPAPMPMWCASWCRAPDCATSRYARSGHTAKPCATARKRPAAGSRFSFSTARCWPNAVASTWCATCAAATSPPAAKAPLWCRLFTPIDSARPASLARCSTSAALPTSRCCTATAGSAASTPGLPTIRSTPGPPSSAACRTTTPASGQRQGGSTRCCCSVCCRIRTSSVRHPRAPGATCSRPTG